MEPISALALALGASWASGLNLYATVLIIGGLGAAGAVDLPTDLEVLTTAPVLITAAVLYGLEFFADKIPGVDSLNDAVHTFIRVPAGALLAMGSMSDSGEPWQAAAALLLGGLVSAGTHAAKTGSRALVNTSPEPFSNWAASIFEDVLVVVGLMLALFQPVLFLIWMAAFGLFLLWFLPKLWRGLCALWRKLQDAKASPGGGRALARALGGPPSGPAGPTPPTRQ